MNGIGNHFNKLFKELFSDIACRTVTPDKTPCMFPFNYKNMTFRSCTKFEAINFWCKYGPQEHEWAFCEDSEECNCESNSIMYDCSMKITPLLFKITFATLWFGVVIRNHWVPPVYSPSNTIPNYTILASRTRRIPFTGARRIVRVKQSACLLKLVIRNYEHQRISRSFLCIFQALILFVHLYK